MTNSHQVYLLHFAPAYKHARHYLGYAEKLDIRLELHSKGLGARLTQVAREHGATLVLTRVWSGSRELERKLKRRHNSPQLCPLCNPRLRRARVGS